ncbi:uncharacterized protein LOC127804455 [Diospyros lotus]|uniref:uncharacterized protein LOC127804455 n=1 Tax=Diospyros lotus TaxID=55363 RepID=UPI00224D12E1|nr:uncharacterized protein LOC127804455 [Diospyros lotus]
MSTSRSSKSKVVKKNTAGNRSDVGWQYAIDVDKNSRKVQCKFCDKIFSRGIFPLKHHLAYTRKDVEPCVSVPNDIKKEMLTILVKNAEATERKRKIIHSIDDSDDEGDHMQHITSKEKGKNTGLDVFLKRGQCGNAIGREENVVQVVTDNAANYKAVGEMLMEKRKGLYWTPCAAHYIDLILEDFDKKPKVHSTTITKARRISTYIYSRTLLISMLRHFTKGRDLIRPVVTRFATVYLTLGCLSELKGPLMTMFTSKSWKSSRFASQQDGKRVQQMVLDSRFWKNIIYYLKATLPLVKVIRLVDLDEQPVIGFLYEEMDRAREKIKVNFHNVKKIFEPILKIIDERSEFQLHRPLHAAAYYLNPHYHYSPNFKVNMEIKLRLFNYIERMVRDPDERDKIYVQLDMFKDAKGLFGHESGKHSKDKKAPGKWWDTYGDRCPEFQRFVIRVLSLTCSSIGCERN